MALGQDPVFHGPKLDWTQDHKSYDRFKDWEREVQLLLNSVYATKPDAFKVNLITLQEHQKLMTETSISECSYYHLTWGSMGN